MVWTPRFWVSWNLSIPYEDQAFFPDPDCPAAFSPDRGPKRGICVT